ncbi:MAG: TetR/AcrR family transcriptional regulator [Clostridiaceae bacterium]|nr:TetR/AcrR family transcriptional regulator [Clostridiaceae bacterium]
MRVVKEYDERKNEILDASEKLFLEKGYVQCTIKDILKAVDIARGTFYYYFESKEEVLDAVIARSVDTMTDRAEEILELEDIDPLEKLIRMFSVLCFSGEEENDSLDNICKPENALLHQKTLAAAVESIAPVLEKVIVEGNQRKVWNCKYPLQYMEIFLVSALSITDEGIFKSDADSRKKHIKALISILAKILDVTEDHFMNLYTKCFGEI